MVRAVKAGRRPPPVGLPVENFTAGGCGIRGRGERGLLPVVSHPCGRRWGHPQGRVKRHPCRWVRAPERLWRFALAEWPVPPLKESATEWEAQDWQQLGPVFTWVAARASGRLNGATRAATSSSVSCTNANQNGRLRRFRKR